MSLRETKKVQVRAHISDVATRLILERGFDAVSVAEIAAAAGVSRMTVFNYFPRKEDMFLDRAPEFRAMLTEAVRSRPAGQSPVAAIRDLHLRLIDERHPLGGLYDSITDFWRVVAASPALRDRARELAEEAEEHMAGLLAEAGDAQPRVTAALLSAAHRVCFLEAARRMLGGEPAESLVAEHRARMARAFDAAAEAAAKIG